MADNLTAQSASPATPSSGTQYRTKDTGGGIHAMFTVDWKGTSLSTPASVNVGTTSGSLIGAGTNRRSIEFCNTGVNDVWIAQGGTTAVVGQGYYLPAGTMRVFDRSPNASFAAIASGGSSMVAIGIEAE